MREYYFKWTRGRTRSNKSLFFIRLIFVFTLLFIMNPYVDLFANMVNESADSPKRVKGVVLDEKQSPLPGATVRIQGKTKATVTDNNGQFAIEISSGDKLIVSYLGYENVAIDYSNQTVLKVVLKESSSVLKDVTVVAYGVQKKATLTGSISSIGAAALLKSPAISLSNSLAGQLSGVTSVQNAGQPGADDAQIFVRGVGSLTESAGAPLIMVDGVERSFFQMDPNEIESINVLKDASATAVFGVRGANGVILVTTRRGVEGKTRISVTSSAGIQMPTRVLKLANSYDYAIGYNEAQRNSGVAEDQLRFSPYTIERFRLKDDPLLYPSIDWYDYYMNDAAVQTQHNINVNGGTKTMRYFVSMGYLFQDGLFKQLEGLTYNNNYAYTRYNYRANLDINITPTTTFKINLGGIVGSRRETGMDVWYHMSYSTPFASPGVIDGKKYVTSSERFKGLNLGTIFSGFYGTGYNRTLSNNMSFDLNLEQGLDFLSKGLVFNVKGSYNSDYAYRRKITGSIETYTPFYKSEIDGLGLSYTDPNFDKTIVNRFTGVNSMNSYSEDSRSRGRNWYMEAAMRYNRTFGTHNVGALVLYNQSKKYYPAQFSDIPTGYVGLVGRITYDYKTKYLAEFNIGYNGSENFTPDKRYGTFPAGSIGYILTQEDFFPKNEFVTYLKLRASVGLVGNDNMASNRFLYLPSSYTVNGDNVINSSYGDVNGYVFGLANTTYDKVASEKRLGSPDVTWETSLKKNIGLDATFIKDRLKLSVDYFTENRSNILIQRNTVPYFASIGTVLPVVNMGKVDNHGYEVDLKWSDKIKDFSYYINANVSYSKNKIVYMDEIEPNEPYMRRTGQDVGAWFGYVMTGFYSANDFNADGSVKSDLPQPTGKVFPGDQKFKDLNGDKIINDDDQMRVANPKRPAYTFGFNYGIEYKGFSASMNWAGAAKCDVLMGNAYRFPFVSDGTLYQFQMDGRWTPERGDAAQFPRFSMSPNTNVSSNWFKDGSYLKLKNLSIGYNINSQKFLKAIGASKFGIQLSGLNLLTLDKVKIFDPEGSLTRDANEYPIMKVVSLGVNVIF